MNARIFYKVTPIAGPPGAIDATNGWIQFGAGASVSTAGAVHTLLSGLTLSIPAGATYGIALEGLTAGNAANIAYTNGAGIVTYTDGGVQLSQVAMLATVVLRHQVLQHLIHVILMVVLVYLLPMYLSVHHLQET